MLSKTLVNERLAFQVLKMFEELWLPVSFSAVESAEIISDPAGIKHDL